MQYRAVQALVRKELAAVDGHLRALFQTPVPILNQVGTHVLAGGGKRFRPTLLLLVSRLRGHPGPDAVLCAAVVEMVHAAALIHDDSVDHSLLRHGLPTVNGLWTDQMAIIMGDFLYAQAMAALVKAKLDMPMSVMARVVTEMSCGEALEFQAAGQTDVAEEQYLEMVRAKTASLIGAACEIGAGLNGGGRDPKRRLRYREFGEKIGVAFQIIDDLLDYLGEAQVTGKPVASDLPDGKITLPLIAAMREAQGADRRRLRQLIETKQWTPARWRTLGSLIERNQGFAYARSCADRLAEEARALIEPESAPSVRRALSMAVDYAVHRDR